MPFPGFFRDFVLSLFLTHKSNCNKLTASVLN